MNAEALPTCESCVHNLHRVGDGRHPRPEPTDLCRNALGVFHMADCPLSIGLACTYYESSAEPHPTTSDLELEAAREEMTQTFLGWRYRRRARWLTKPRNLVPTGIVIEGAVEPVEDVPETLAMRVPAPEVAAVLPAPGAAEPSADGATAPAAPVPAAPERYPGQRRSEERLAKKRARLAALDAAKAAKEAQIAAAAQNPPPEEFDDEEGDDGPGDDEFGGDLAEPEPVDTGPKTVEQILAALPDAPIVTGGERRQGGGGGRPPGDGHRRHRRRRGRRGGGGGGGAQGGPGGQGRGPRPGGPPRGGGGPRPERRPPN